MKKIILSIKALCFVFIFLFLYINIENILVGANRFYQVDDEVDVLFFGTSLSYCNFNPAVLYENYGIKSYNLGKPQSSIALSYHIMKDALKYQKPKVMVLEIAGFEYDYEDMDEKRAGINASSLNDMKLSLNKVEAVFNNVEIESKYNLLFPLLQKHSNWKILNEESFHDTDFINGYLMLTESKEIPRTAQTLIEREDRIDLSDKNSEYLSKIISLANENEIKLLFVKAPLPVYWQNTTGITNTISDIANENDIGFINFYKLYNEIKFNFKYDTADGSHLNVFGAEKVTNYLGEYLIENYDIGNRKSADNQDWDDMVQLYHRKQKDAFGK